MTDTKPIHRIAIIGTAAKFRQDSFSESLLYRCAMSIRACLPLDRLCATIQRRRSQNVGGKK